MTRDEIEALHVSSDSLTLFAMTEDYCKLASGIILSTIWREDDHTRILWITMLALKNRDHRVLASVPGLAAVANIPMESCRAGLIKLSSQDLDSRTKEHQGRRIAEIEGGWLILNGEKYRNFMSKQERNEYQARLMSERRAAKKLAPVSTKLAELAHTEAEAEAEAEAKATSDKPPTPLVAALPFSSDAFKTAWEDWKADRKSRKKTITTKAQELQLKKIAAWGEAKAIQSITDSIANGWQGLFEPKPNEQHHSYHPGSARSVSSERNALIIDADEVTKRVEQEQRDLREGKVIFPFDDAAEVDRKRALQKKTPGP